MSFIDISKLRSEAEVQGPTVIPHFSTQASMDNDIDGGKILSMPDDQLTVYLGRHLSMLLDAFYNRGNKAASEILSDVRVLQIITNLIRSTPFGLDDVYRLNKMVYDGVAAQHLQNKKPYFLNVGRTLNTPIYNRLIAYVSDEVAVRLCAARHSSADPLTVVKRMSRVMHLCSVESMTEQIIVNIFGCCFDSATKVFEGVMFDVVDAFTNKNAEEMYSTISLAALDIVESMPLPYIKQTLTAYYNDIAFLGVGRTRFELTSVNAIDYPRIRTALEQLTSSNPM